MKKLLLIAGVIVGVVIIGLGFYLAERRRQDKALSPEAKALYRSADLELTVFYNRPYKRGRQIFGNLVPYGALWRTGANEATVFSNSEEIQIGGQHLPAGRYQLLTIPDRDKWKIIFNADVPGWGIDQSTGRPYRNKNAKEWILDVPAEQNLVPLEQFTIQFEEKDDTIELQLLWDQTRVHIPIKRKDA